MTPSPTQFWIAPEQVWKTSPIHPHGQFLPLGGVIAYQRAHAVLEMSPIRDQTSLCSNLVSLSVTGSLQLVHPIFSLVPNLDFFCKRRLYKVIINLSISLVLTVCLHKNSVSQKCEGHTKPYPSVRSSCDAESICLSRSLGTVQPQAHSPACSPLRVKNNPWAQGGKKSNHPSDDG